METINLLNIEPTASKASNNLLGKASGVDLYSSQRDERFKSAFKAETAKHAEKNERSENKNNESLPQSGKALPDKNSSGPQETVEQKIENRQSHDKNNSSQDRVDSVAKHNGVKDEKVGKDEHNVSDEYADVNRVATEKSTETVQKTEHQLIPEINQVTGTGQSLNEPHQPGQVIVQQQNVSVSQDGVSHDMVQEVDTHPEQSAINTLPPSIDFIAQEDSDTQETDESSSLTTIQSIIPGLLVSDNNSADHRKSPETVTVSNNSIHASYNNTVASEFASRSEEGRKDNSAFGKSIADFKQFIELSQKQSSMAEPITSVKNFEESLKVEQANAINMKSENRVLSGQIINQAHIAMQGAGLERTTSLLTPSASSPLQNINSMEVKTMFGKAGWNQSFSNQIVMMAKNGLQQAKIRLNPMHLGPVEAMVKISGDTAVVNLASLHLTTKEAMDAAIPRLKEMLNENGFSQVDVNVSHQDKQNQRDAELNLNKERSDGEHGNSTMPGEEQLSEEDHDADVIASDDDSDVQGLNVVDYYA